MNQPDFLQTKYDPDTFRYHPMFHVWCDDMKRNFIHAVVNNPKCINAESIVQTVINKPEFTVVFAGDKDFYEKWLMISKCLAELYIKVRWMLTKYGCEVHMVELYREKYEQALDWLSGDRSNIPPLLKCGMIARPSINQIDDIAKQILIKRSQWLERLSEIEHLRITAKREILQGSVASDIHNIMLNAVDLLTKLDQKWTLT